MGVLELSPSLPSSHSLSRYWCIAKDFIGLHAVRDGDGGDDAEDLQLVRGRIQHELTFSLRRPSLGSTSRLSFRRRLWSRSQTFCHRPSAPQAEGQIVNTGELNLVPSVKEGVDRCFVPWL